ncbi:urease accessory protein UreF [Pseudenhygromyxa sp. WMMC2535]|uniref:urease accessory protein UreF n=1 Tax=Pseudenhygromyxa sp. WMMC2535 TaxID=2712867 RepID=UPI001555373A|nr:urease accessory UreF family protein [Pseudenhygromyxa sp. WMMC2535]NVB37529.1 urease accessory protein UreF [Pseudenhygromyxa sp. WMMC2535]
MIEPLDAAALLRLLQLSSPALPVGAYAYSHGLEAAVSAGWVHDRESAAGWILGVAEHAIASLELPLLARLIPAYAAGDHGQVAHWTNFLCAARESEELAREDRHMGLALARLLVDLGVDEAAGSRGDPNTTYVGAFALACARWRVPVRAAMHALAFGFCENQVAAAIKLVPLGQTDGQRVLVAAMAEIPGWIDAAEALDDDALGPLAPGLALASARHEQQYSRLFRS